MYIYYTILYFLVFYNKYSYFSYNTQKKNCFWYFLKNNLIVFAIPDSTRIRKIFFCVKTLSWVGILCWITTSCRNSIKIREKSTIHIRSEFQLQLFQDTNAWRWSEGERRIYERVYWYYVTECSKSLAEI